ncbi:MAG: DUF1028 domain-containing protein [Phycisphaerales bacterium]|nr:DUF1028 domain-containing protein [Phycisphaerales bacterium]
MLRLSLVIALAVAGCSQRADWRASLVPASPRAATAPGELRRPVATYSIVARDPATGQMGVAVQSHWFSVGPIVPWAEAGVGAVATQSLVDPAYGPLGLEMMRLGRSAPEALAGLLASDENREVRQVAMVDARGGIAAHTGARCIAAAGCIVDTDQQFSCQANLMEKDTVWPAMGDAYLAANGDLADRLLAALDAAQAEGGDIRGRQSAAILIVAPTSTGKPWVDRLFDLRVEDHPEPLEELRRLVGVQRAYNHMNAGDLAMEHGDFDGANREYTKAEQLQPQIVEISFWRATTLVASGKVEESLPIFKRVFAQEPNWAVLVPRLVDAGLLTDDEAVIARILEQR